MDDELSNEPNVTIADRYTICWGTVDQVETQVNKNLGNDWLLFGTMTVRDNGICYQAMIKKIF